MNSQAEVKLAERLASIITQLNDAKTLSISSLAKEFNVSVRTVQRDLNERLSFLPILESKGHYSLAPSALGKLSPKDIRHFAAISGIESLYPNLDTRFICSILSQAIDSPYLIKGHNYEPKHKVEPNLNKLEEVIQRNKRINFSYKNKQYNNIAPYRLVNSKGIWYLAAVDDNTLKSFHLSELTHILEQAEAFTSQQHFIDVIEQDDGIFFSETKFEVVVKVSKDIAQYFLRRNLFPNQRIIEELETGELLVSSRVATSKQILPLIKYWVPEIEVVSPDEIKQTLIQELKKYVAS
ncbi:transcriptional regulator [Pseudoalteromonas sp. NCCP-2140]|uniref:helix-turn-helix transcriptional regulator n=1 Tax=Pseudoalteromonas sp. NCCP-2140 TaxID=2942288 RepID=UPI00203A6CAB|nr:WYL domain-containing protein [Pseudoalteromonas sp. NCCP-2140]GKW54095.1 transcriptional regulator [Pseudoalteromonas sp. NCCP-2140]